MRLKSHKREILTRKCEIELFFYSYAETDFLSYYLYKNVNEYLLVSL